MSTIKLRRSESFYIREGWFEKAINTIDEHKKNIFFKNDGIENLGIGSNMVKGLKYWLKSADIIEGPENELTDFAKLLLRYDRYLDDLFSWFLIHYNLCINKDDCPVFYEVANSNVSSFEKNEMLDYLMNHFTAIDPTINKKLLDADLGTYLKTYVNEDTVGNPEDNYVSPLSRLKLMKKERSGVYQKLKPVYSSLSYLVIYYALMNTYEGQPFVIEESISAVSSPARIFNLDKYMYLQYLDDARRNGLITINRTAGLNTVYFEKKLTLAEIFRVKFGGPENV